MRIEAACGIREEEKRFLKLSVVAYVIVFVNVNGLLRTCSRMLFLCIEKIGTIIR